MANIDPVQDILDQFELAPGHLVCLPSTERRRLLNFLLQWEHYPALHACLDVLLSARPNMLTLLDLRARALLAQGEHQRAIEVMNRRLEITQPMTARILLAQIHLARGDTASSRKVAGELVDQHPSNVMIWSLLAQVELACGDTAAALNACRRQAEQYEQSRSYLLDMMDVYRARQEWVTASGYAVRALRTAADDSPLSVSHSRRLLDYFEASEETTRVDDLKRELADLYQRELQALREALSPGARGPRSADQAAKPGQAVAPAPPALTLDQIPVSQAERAYIAEAVKRFFGFETLLPGQTETLACVLRGEDTLAILPTGGGKSLCYQLPAMLDNDGTTLVISPLIALMKDQVDSLPEPIRRNATAINSSLEGDQLHHRLQRFAQGSYRLVYVAPERLRQPTFLHAARKAKLNRLVIDEAHCVSVWGHDFRPDYLYIGHVRQALGNPPLLGLTATAPPRVRRDIVQHLGKLRVVAGDVTRPNLTLEVFYAQNADDKLSELLAFCKAARGSGIVYVDTRARSERLSALLCQHEISAAHYHAGIPNRTQVQDDFMSDRVRVVVATIAFGMGIDKPDIRFIVHFNPAASLEAYYQEAGRAGRDGLPSHCLLMYAPSDRATLTRRSRRDLIETDFLRSIYAAVKRRLNGQTEGRVSQSDLERDLRAEGTRVRVALSLLEEAGLLRRGPDIPRTATVRILHEPFASDSDPAVAALHAFSQVAHLRPGQPLDLDLLVIARQAGLPLETTEQSLLEWADAGRLTYYASSRDMLLELPPAPTDAAQRVETLIERHATIQVQRVDEIIGYAQTRRCRHGHINAYLGGQPIERCSNCDNCIEIAPRTAPGLSDEREQLRIILQCVADAPWGWGRATLVRILSGDLGGRRNRYPLRPEARAQAQFGMLAFRAQGAIEKLLDRLIGSGLLRERRIDRGGAVLELTELGQATLAEPGSLDDLAQPPSTQLQTASPNSESRTLSPTEPPPKPDQELLKKLHAWRRALAKENQVAPHFIMHNNHLVALAADRPTTLDALAQIKGIGPKRLEQYGKALLNIIRTHLETNV